MSVAWFSQGLFIFILLTILVLEPGILILRIYHALRVLRIPLSAFRLDIGLTSLSVALFVAFLFLDGGGLSMYFFSLSISCACFASVFPLWRPDAKRHERDM